MRDFWQVFKEAWGKLNPPQRILGGIMMLFLLETLLLPFVSFGTRGLDKADAPTVSEETAVKPQEPFRLANESFKDEVLISLYQSGKWDGEPVESNDGTHLATINFKGFLVIDGQETSAIPDLSRDVKHSSFTAIYRDAATGTYVCTNTSWTTTSEDQEFTCWKKGEKTATVKTPYLEKAYNVASGAVYLEHTVLMSSYSEKIIMRLDPRKEPGSQFEVLTDDIGALLFNKISSVKARFVKAEFTDPNNPLVPSSYTLYEVGETGGLTKVAQSSHYLRVRALEDYPSEGDFAEFWLLRTAYLSGKWNGQIAKIREIARLSGVSLTRTPTDQVKNTRAPSLSEIDFSSLDPEAFASVNRWTSRSMESNTILVNNVPKYYLHATKPFQVSDISYRKVKNLYDGFVELTLGGSRDYFNYNGMGLYTSPSCYFTYGAMTEDLQKGDLIDFSNSIVPLPYYSLAYHEQDITAPPDFLAALELIDAINYDNGMRAVCIGQYNTTDIDDPEANFTLYLSRKNAAFDEVATNVVSAHFFSTYSYDYISRENWNASHYDHVGIWITGREKEAKMEDVFAFANTLTFYEGEPNP